ncbi:MAG: porin [Wenzhouxiangella sp.]|nr:MAG: porin [Wenzhouxiangella sp.]
MKRRMPRVRPLIAALALAGAISLPVAASADEPDTSFSVFLRLQAEVVNASGSLPEALDRKGWHVADGWANGGPNSGNWGAVFFDLSHQVNDDLRGVARYALNTDVDGRKDTDRHTYVGLASKRFGQVVVGRTETPYKTFGLGWDPFNATFLQARGNQGVSFGQFGHGGFVNRSIRYDHTINQVQVAAFVGIDDSSDPGTGDTRGNHTYSFSAIAPVGPVQLLLSYIDASEYRGGPDDREGWKFGVRYSEGPLALSARYELRDSGLDDGDFLNLSASYRVGQVTYAAGYGRFNDDRDGRGNDGEYFMLGARYSLRQGVALHGGFRRSDRDVTGTENMFGIGLRVFYNTGNLLAR